MAKYQEFRRNDSSNNSGTDDKSIRKIYISPITPPIRSLVRGYFSQFGAVESVRMHAKDDFCYGFVQFKTAESARIALQKPKHRIGKRMVNVKLAHSWHQPNFERLSIEQKINNTESAECVNSEGIPGTNDPLFMPAEQNSESPNLATLNDDCLQHMFKFLPLKDLCNAAEVCVRFKENAETYFKSHHSKMTSLEWRETVVKNDTWDVDDDEMEPEIKYDLKFIGQCLRLFGSHIKMLALFDAFDYDAQRNNKMLSMVSRYCTGTLKTLKLFGLTIGTRIISTLQPLFVSLEEICIVRCDINNSFRKLLLKCAALKTLKLCFCSEFNDKCLRVKFPKSLTELSFLHIHDYMSRNFMDHIMRLNPQLEKLSIIQCETPSSVIKVIATRLPKLQTLHIDPSTDESKNEINKNAQHLIKMKSLKKLVINGSTFDAKPLIDGIVKAKTPIEHFGFLSGEIDLELLKSLSTLNTLTGLELLGTTMKKVSLIDVAKHLPKLIELQTLDIKEVNMVNVKKMLPFAQKLCILGLASTESELQIDEETYQSILHTVKNRGNSTKLAVSISSKQSKVLVPQNVLLKNRHWLTIEKNTLPDYCTHDDDEDDDSDEEISFDLYDSDSYDEDDDDDDDDDIDFRAAMGFVVIALNHASRRMHH